MGKSLLVSILLLMSVSASADPNCSGVFDQTFFYDFRTACFKHDVCYSEGAAAGLTKADCDKRFRTSMNLSCKGRSFLCTLTSSLFYSAMSAKSYEARFEEVSDKGLNALQRMRENRDLAALELFNDRAFAQAAWTLQAEQCLKLSGENFVACTTALNNIYVPDMPHRYPLGDCNILGINWRVGHRQRNLVRMSRLTGVPIEQILEKKYGDACAGRYP